MSAKFPMFELYLTHQHFRMHLHNLLDMFKIFISQQTFLVCDSPSLFDHCWLLHRVQITHFPRFSEFYDNFTLEQIRLYVFVDPCSRPDLLLLLGEIPFDHAVKRRILYLRLFWAIIATSALIQQIGQGKWDKTRTNIFQQLIILPICSTTRRHLYELPCVWPKIIYKI